MAGLKFPYASSTDVRLRFIIERVTGMSHEKNLQEQIIKMAGTTHSRASRNAAVPENREDAQTLSCTLGNICVNVFLLCQGTKSI